MADSSRRSTRFSARSKMLGQLLLENSDVMAEQVAQALKTQEQQGGLVGQLLQGMEACSAQAIAAALLKQVQVTDVRCEELQVQPSVADLVPRELCEAERLCPFERLGGLLCLVMGNPLNRKAILQIEERARLKVKSFKAPWPRIQELLQRTYGGAGFVLPEALEGEVPAEGLDAGAGEAPASGELAVAPALEEPQPGEEAPLAEAPSGEGAPAAEAPADEGAPVAEALPDEGAPVAEALPDEGAPAAEALADEGAAPAEEPQPEPEPQAADAQQPESWEEPGAGGIVPVTEALLSGSGARRVHEPEPPPPPKIQGLENLDESHAEMIETTPRGLSRRGTRAGAAAEEATGPQEQKAKINVDLDKLDFSGVGTVAVKESSEGALEEVVPPASPPLPLQPGEREAPPSSVSVLGLVPLKTVPDSYFFADGSAPAETRPDELLDLLSGLPIAETVAQSAGEYAAQSAAKAAPVAPEIRSAAPADKPIELQSAPAAPVAALPVSASEFDQAAVALVEDPVGEWEWQYAAPGPLEVVAYEEN